MTKIVFPKTSFDHYYTCPAEVLEEEISRSTIRLKLQDVTRTETERILYQENLDRIAVLKSISLLRQKRITREQFGLKTELI